MDKKLKKTIHYIILFLIIALSLFRIIYTFAFLKEGTHSDEEWSYGLANSYYEPYIYQNADETDAINVKQWLSSDVFKDYLTVNPEHRFSYGSVFYNQSKDLHPPLYYLILHTICSFFPEKFSFWYGFSINIIVFILTMVFLYLLIREITDSDITAISGCILYGFSMGALNTFVYVRMYALLTMFSVLSAFLHAKLYKTGTFKKYIPLLFVITVLGALTHHYFLAFAGLFSACFCFWYLFSKQFKKMFIYAFSMLFAVGTSILIFPATINHLFGRRGEIAKFEPYWQINMCLDYAFSELFAVHFSAFRSPVPSIIAVGTLFVLILLTPIAFLFRNEKWFRKFLSNFRNFLKRALSWFIKKIKHMNTMVIALFISSIGMIITTAATISIIHMEKHTDRYMFFIFPILCTAMICLLYYILKWFISSPRLKQSLTVLSAAIICVASNFDNECLYLFHRYDDEISISETIAGSNCIYITRAYWLLTCFSKEALSAENIYVTTPEKTNLSNIPPINSELPVYMIVDESAYYVEEPSSNEDMVIMNNLPGDLKATEECPTKDEFEEIIKNLDICKEFTHIGYCALFGKPYRIYRIA